MSLPRRKKQRLALKLAGVSDEDMYEVLAMRDAAKGRCFFGDAHVFMSGVYSLDRVSAGLVLLLHCTSVRP